MRASWKWIYCLIAVGAVLSHTRGEARFKNDDTKFPGVSLTVVSKLPRPAAKPSQGDPQMKDYQEWKRDDLLVRVRLANTGEVRVYYLAPLNNIEPAGFQLFRAAGEQSWKSASPAH